MTLRRRKLAEFRPLDGDDTREADTCDLEDEIYYEYPIQKECTLVGRDFQWAEAAIEPCGERKGTFYVYKWGTKFIDLNDYVDIWSHGRLFFSIRCLGHGDGEIMGLNFTVSNRCLDFLWFPAQRNPILTNRIIFRIGTSDIKNILEAITKRDNFAWPGQRDEETTHCLGNHDLPRSKRVRRRPRVDCVVE